jgi:nucleotidyltransferase/DNA polymerase involved in DNA repair
MKRGMGILPMCRCTQQLSTVFRRFNNRASETSWKRLSLTRLFFRWREVPEYRHHGQDAHATSKMHRVPPARSILHVDMDAFFAAVEQLDHPEIRAKPVLVGHDGPRGVVAAASYEARKFGCHSAQPMSQAKRLCPHAVVMPGRFSRYREISGQLFDILGDFSPLVEPISVDEAFVDLTGTERLHGTAIDVASKIKQRVRNELHLTASVGVAPNKFLAKLASDLQKPDGLTVINADSIDTILPPLPLTRIWGIGPKTARDLERAGLRTIGDLRKAGLKWLSERFGESGEHYFRLALGQDSRDVTPDSNAKSIGQEQTFGVDLIHLDEIRSVLLSQVENVAARVRRHGRRAGSVHLKIRFGDFQTITRSQTLSEPTDSTAELWNAAKLILETWAERSFSPVRLIGMQASTLTDEPAQQKLFADASQEKQRKLDRAVDAINQRLGSASIRRGGAKP